MSILKNFDFFQKISVENVSKPTIVGSILSLSAISIMCFLLFREIHDFYSPTFIKDTIIYHDKDQDSKIAVNLHLQFFHMPCSLLSVDQQDSMGNHRMDVSDTLKKHRYTKDNQEIQKGLSHDLDDVMNSVEEDEQCKITGHVDIHKVPGNIHISHHAYKQLWEYLRHAKPQKFPKLTLSHKAMGINFGDYQHLREIFKRFDLVKQHSEFNRHDTLPTFLNLEKKDFDYFIKIIPNLFVDEELGTSIIGYQYSLNFKEKEYQDEPGNQHIITMNYDFSPITMRTIRKRNFTAHF